MKFKLNLFLHIFVLSLVTTPPAYAQQTGRTEREAMYYSYENLPSFIKGGSVEPHWMADGNSFWYADGDPNNTIIHKVDPVANTKEPLFDRVRLRRVLTSLLGHELPYQGLPFQEFTWVNGENAVRFEVEDKPYILQLDTYTITPSSGTYEAERNRMVPRSLFRKIYPKDNGEKEILSPDGRWFAGVDECNLWLRSTSDDSREQLTTDGIEGYEWGYVGHELPGVFGPRWVTWPPDSSRLAVKKTDYRQVKKMPVVDWLKSPEDVQWLPFAGAGEPMPTTELYIVDVHSKQQVAVDSSSEQDHWLGICGWRPDGSELFFVKWNRTFQKVELMAANPMTGATRVVLGETYRTLWSVHFPFHEVAFFTLLNDGNRFLWMSEKDGWRHIYLYGIDGALIRRLTEGNFPVVKLVAVDERRGWVYFTAHGDQQRPYDTHLYRVNLQGEGFTPLTEAIGQHAIDFSPSRQFFLDTHSTTARSPAVDLRNADGTMLQTLSKANIDALKELRWKPPEEFVVKAADGKTDLWGVLYKPYDFDPNKKYPVVDHIYGGPGSVYVRRTFGRSEVLAQLGFIVFKVDGRGTPDRGKTFQDVGYGKERHVIGDHVAVLKQLAAQRPYMDLSRVGIIGASRGGYNTIRAILLAPDVYHVGVAFAPLTDWEGSHPIAEYWLGLPQENREWYDDASNLRLAENLRGKLLLVHGTHDLQVPFSQTMRMVDALARAGKPYDLIVLSGAGHRLGWGAQYAREARRRYLQEHLKPVPTVEITEPVEGRSFEQRESILLKARASASADARVLRVEFMVDGQPIGVDPEPPYEFHWPEAKKGRHVVTARVYDSSGRNEPSKPVNLRVGMRARERSITRSTDDTE